MSGGPGIPLPVPVARAGIEELGDVGVAGLAFSGTDDCYLHELLTNRARHRDRRPRRRRH